MRPYSVFVDVPGIFSGLIAVKTRTRFVDRALAPGQIQSYGLFESRVKTAAACFFASSIIWVLPIALLAIEGVTALARRDYSDLAWVLGIFLAWAAVAISSSRYLSRETKTAEAAVVNMKGLIAPVPEDGTEQDLARIQTALNVLQPEHGTAFDDRARAAVAAVLDQNLHRPNEKHLIIAESTAVDADSTSIRKRTLEAKALWSRDVARAEHLVLELEDAAAGSVPATV